MTVCYTLKYKNIKKIIHLVVILLLVSSCSNSHDDLATDPILDNQPKYVLSLDKSIINLGVGERVKLKPTLTKDGVRVNFKDYTLSVSTDNGKVEKLSEGADSIICLIGMSDGESKLNVVSKNENVGATCNLKITKKTIKILAIGNSFSEDAVESYLWDIANADGVDVVIGNITIGSCSLAQHLKNAENNSSNYSYKKIIKGIATVKNKVTLSVALEDEEWDYISFQEVSELSGIYESYETSLPSLVKYAKGKAPNAKLMLHQTWAYAKNSSKAGFSNYQNRQNEMYTSIVSAVRYAAELVDIDIIIPAGTAIQNGRTSSLGDTFCSSVDGSHLNATYGRYTASCTWYNKIFNRSVINNNFAPNFSEWRRNVAKYAASSAIKNPNNITMLINYLDKEPS